MLAVAVLGTGAHAKNETMLVDQAVPAFSPTLPSELKSSMEQLKTMMHPIVQLAWCRYPLPGGAALGCGSEEYQLFQRFCAG